MHDNMQKNKLISTSKWLNEVLILVFNIVLYFTSENPGGGTFIVGVTGEAGLNRAFFGKIFPKTGHGFSHFSLKQAAYYLLLHFLIQGIFCYTYANTALLTFQTS